MKIKRMWQYLERTERLNFDAPAIQTLAADRGWSNLPEKERIASIYRFVRDEIPFGYNADDGLTATAVLEDGMGQCNTKATLLMALLRAVGIPCRLHGFTIHKLLQKGAQTGLVYWLSPREIVHSWVEVLYDGRWCVTEGVILDSRYLRAVQKRFGDCRGSFCGYGVATEDLQHPAVDWDGNDTYIQREGIVRDFGVFASPDVFLEQHGQAWSPCKQWLYVHVGRKCMNRNVRRMRSFAPCD